MKDVTHINLILINLVGAKNTLLNILSMSLPACKISIFNHIFFTCQTHHHIIYVTIHIMILVSNVDGC